jgi:F-type H+-transporting ATPase subunit gamma
MLANVAAAAATTMNASAQIRCWRARPEKRILLVLVTSDKGLAGAFNANLIKGRAALHREHPKPEVKLELIGRKGRDFFRKRGAKITASTSTWPPSQSMPTRGHRAAR